MHLFSPVNGLVAAFIIAYPLVVYFGFSRFDARFLGGILIMAGIANLVASRRGAAASSGFSGGRARVIFFASILVGLTALVSNTPGHLLFYPLCMNAAMFVLFAASLFRPPTIVEHLARLADPDLSESGVRYARNVTILWCLFFILNGSAALYTATKTSIEVWTLYNGLVAYILMGLLFAGEYVVRVKKRRKDGVQFSR